MKQSEANELLMRQIALDQAVKTHGHAVDEEQTVKAAEAYLAFLKGQKPLHT